MWCLFGWRGWSRDGARCARVCTGSDRAGLCLLWCRWGGSSWSGGCWQGAEPLPAGEERVCPGPGGADLQDAFAGVAGEPGGDVPDPVTECVGVGFPQVRVVAEAEQAGPGGEVGGDVRGDDPAGVDLPGLRREVPQAHGLGGPDAAGFDDGVLAVGDVDVLGVVAARDAADSAVRDVGAGDGVPPAGLFLVSGEVAHLAAGRLDSAGDPAQPAGPLAGPGHQAGDLGDALVFLDS